MKKTALLLLVLVVSLSCATGGPPAEPGAQAATPTDTSTGVSDSEIGLAPGTAFEQPTQAPVAFNSKDPGESTLRPRPNLQYPPAIPHTIEDLEVITLGENSCLECHDASVAEDFGAVAVPASHRVDLRRAPETTGEDVVGARWVCTSCHVPQTDTEPLVENPSSRGGGP